MIDTAHKARSAMATRFNPVVADLEIARVTTQFHLRIPGGAYLNLDGSGTTETSTYAWIGSKEKASAMRRRNPLAARMALVHAQVWRPRDTQFERELRK